MRVCRRQQMNHFYISNVHKIINGIKMWTMSISKFRKFMASFASVYLIINHKNPNKSTWQSDHISNSPLPCAYIMLNIKSLLHFFFGTTTKFEGNPKPTCCDEQAPGSLRFFHQRWYLFSFPRLIHYSDNVLFYLFTIYQFCFS